MRMGNYWYIYIYIYIRALYIYILYIYFVSFVPLPGDDVCMYVCMILTYSKNKDQPGKVANPACGQLNKENSFFPFAVRAWEFDLARRIRQSRPASACSYLYSGWIWCLLTSFLPISAAASMYLFLKRHTPSGQSRVYRVTQLRTDGVHCREPAGTGPVNLKVVPVTAAALAGHHGPIDMRLSFHTPTIGMKWLWHVEIIGGMPFAFYFPVLFVPLTEFPV